MSNSVKDRIARLQAIAAQKQTGVAIMLLLEKWRVGGLQSAAKPCKGVSDGTGSTRLFIRLRKRYHYRPLKKTARQRMKKKDNLHHERI